MTRRISGNSGLDAGRRQQGFTLWEVLAAIAVVVVMMAALMPTLTGAMQYSAREKTRSRLNELHKAMVSAYQNNAMVIDDRGGDDALISPKTSYDGTPKAELGNGLSIPVSHTTGEQSGFVALARYAGTSATSIDTDGFNHPWHVYVSNRLSRQWHGYTVYFHVIAFVSNNGGQTNASGPVLASGTQFNKNTGQLTLGGNDVGVTINGYPIEVAKYKASLKTMHHVASRYASFFTSRYLGSSSRNMSVDFFSRSCPSNGTNAGQYDGGSPIANSCIESGGYRYPGSLSPGFAPTAGGSCNGSARLNDTSTGFAGTLGLSHDGDRSAWGQPLGYGDGPNAECRSGGARSRNPSSGSTTMRTPPYTALIEAWAPGGVPLTVTASGTY